MNRLAITVLAAALAVSPAIAIDEDNVDEDRRAAFKDRVSAPTDLGQWAEVITVSKEGEVTSYRTLGEGPSVVLVPSLGRGAADFDHLARRLSAAGYRAIAVDPPGVLPPGVPKGKPKADADLYDFACIAATAVAQDYRTQGRLDLPPAVFIGHAFGNRVVRALAADRPDLVRGLVLLAAGGQVKIPDEISAAIPRPADPTLPEAERLAALETAFFAPGNDASVWLGGWHGDVMRAQIAAIGRTGDERWKTPPDVPMLIVQPEDDVIAPPANAEALKAVLGDNVSLVTIPEAGHALLPEQGDAVAASVLDFLRDLKGRAETGLVGAPATARCQDLP